MTPPDHALLTAEFFSIKSECLELCNEIRQSNSMRCPREMRCSEPRISFAKAYPRVVEFRQWLVYLRSVLKRETWYSSLQCHSFFVQHSCLNEFILHEAEYSQLKRIQSELCESTSLSPHNFATFSNGPDVPGGCSLVDEIAEVENMWWKAASDILSLNDDCDTNKCLLRIEHDLQQVEAQFHCFQIQLNDVRRKLTPIPQYCENFTSELEMLHLSVEKSLEALSTIEKLLQFLVDHSCNTVVQAMCSIVKSTKLVHMSPENVGILRELAACTINLINVGRQIKLDELELLEMWNSHPQRNLSEHFEESPADTRFSQESGLGICSSGFSSLPCSAKHGDTSELWERVYTHRRSVSAPTLTPDEIVAQSPLMHQPLGSPVIPHADACSLDSFFMDTTLLDLGNESSGFGCDVSLVSDDGVSRPNIPFSFRPFVSSSEMDLSNTFAPPKYFHQPPCSTSSYGYKSAHHRTPNYTASLNRLNSVCGEPPPSADPNNHICTSCGSTGHVANAVFESRDLCESPCSTNQLVGFDISTVLSTPFTRLPDFGTVDESKNLGDTMPAAEQSTRIHHPRHLSPSRDVVGTSALHSTHKSKWKQLARDPKCANCGPAEETTPVKGHRSASVPHFNSLAAYSHIKNTDECKRVSQNALPNNNRNPRTISQSAVSGLIVTIVSLVTLMLLSFFSLVHTPGVTRQTVSEPINHTPEDNYPFCLISPELGVGLLPFRWLRQMICLQPPDAKYVPY